MESLFFLFVFIPPVIVAYIVNSTDASAVMNMQGFTCCAELRGWRLSAAASKVFFSDSYFFRLMTNGVRR